MKATLIGGGVIGGGWAGRLIENGVDVTVFDPHPQAAARLAEMLENAARAWSRLTLAPRRKGTLTWAGSVAAAVQGADFIQESAPEDEALKRALLAEIDRHAPAQTVIVTSTSGLLPSRLQQDMRHPERLVVGHPFNPVYLLPLVEVLGGDRTAPAAIERACNVYEALGMKPLRLKREIDGFVADRLLEALWREALWLVHDDVATAAEIDDAIRYGAGLRWAQMGTFLVYRIAGGAAGMRHFMAQFGPALKWPWTKLMDVPELTESFLDKLAAQSDAQAEGHSIGELERQRDDNLVAILQALRGQDYAAGAVLRRHEAALFDAAHPIPAFMDNTGPLELYGEAVRPDWVDYNGHMTESRYLEAFGNAGDALLAYVGCDASYRATGFSLYTVETHLRHLHEIAGLQHFAVSTQLLGADEKRIHVFHRMRHAASGDELATCEQMLLHVDTAAGRAWPMQAPLAARVAALAAAQAALPVPSEVGRAIAMQRPAA